MKNLEIPGEHLAPQLSYICFTGIAFSPKLLHGSHIRGLELSDAVSTRLLALSTFLETLASLEQLEMLALEESLPLMQHKDPAYAAVATVRLPRLLLLTVHDVVYRMIAFLNKVDIGLSTNVSLTANNDEYGPIEWRLLLRCTLTRMVLTPRLPWLTVSVSCTGRYLRAIVQREGPAVETSGPMLTIHSKLCNTDDDRYTILMSLFEMVPHMHTLRLAGDAINIDWQDSKGLQSLRTVEATGAAAVHIIQFLIASSMEASAGRVLWPGLCNVDITGGHHSSDDLRGLEDALRLREKVVGRRVASLRVCASEVGEVGADVADLVHGGPEGKKPEDGHKAFSDEFSARMQELVGL
jgi:hypothetical protein